MAREVATTEKQAEYLKDQGNIYFKKDKLGAAIEAYTEAITLCPKVPVFWTNRALCHKKRNEWDRVENDCLKALELDNNSTKAHYWYGLALLQRKQYHEAVRQLEKALELGRGGSSASYLVEEIQQELTKARYLAREHESSIRYAAWERESSIRQRQQRELKEHCAHLLKLEYENKCQGLKKEAAQQKGYTEGADGVLYMTDDDDDDDISAVTNNYYPSAQKQDRLELDEQQKAEIAKLNETYQERLVVLDEVFHKASAPDTAGEVPEYLCCLISTDIFRDPVITPSGVTYERDELMEHLRKVGQFDPYTRATLHPEQVVPNLAIKEAVQAYLAEHGWAYKT